MAEWESGRWERSLPFPLKEPEYSEYSDNNAGVVTKTTPDIFNPDEPDEIIDIHFRMSMSQFTAIASAIDIGRDIGYGERSFELWRTWCKALIGEIIVSCEDIADCIDTSEIVQEAINNQIDINSDINQTLARKTSKQVVQLGFDGDTTVVASSTLSQPVKPLADCDKDALWAGIREGLVQRLDDNGRQFLEILAGQANLPERIVMAIGAVPVLGDVVESVLEQFTEIIPDLLDAYNAYSSIDNLDTAACEIFGLVCSLCRYPTTQELYDYFGTLGATGLDDITTLTSNVAYGILAGLTTGTGIIVWHSLIAVQLLTLLMDEKFSGLVGIDSVANMASFGEDFGNDNWQTLCDDCVAQYSVWEWEFADGMGDFYIIDVSGIPQAVLEGGSMESVPSGSNRTIQIALPLQNTWRIIGARVAYEVTNQNQTVMRYRQYAGSNTNAVNPSISNCTEAGTGYRLSYQGTDIHPPQAPVTDKREFVLVLGATGLASILRVHRIAFEFEYDYGKQPGEATEDSEFLWCP